jgi:hypothetical protein
MFINKMFNNTKKYIFIIFKVYIILEKKCNIKKIKKINCFHYFLLYFYYISTYFIASMFMYFANIFYFIPEIMVLSTGIAIPIVLYKYISYIRNGGIVMNFNYGYRNIENGKVVYYQNGLKNCFLLLKNIIYYIK